MSVIWCRHKCQLSQVRRWQGRRPGLRICVCPARPAQPHPFELLPKGSHADAELLGRFCSGHAGVTQALTTQHQDCEPHREDWRISRACTGSRRAAACTGRTFRSWAILRSPCSRHRSAQHPQTSAAYASAAAQVTLTAMYYQHKLQGPHKVRPSSDPAQHSKHSRCVSSHQAWEDPGCDPRVRPG